MVATLEGPLRKMLAGLEPDPTGTPGGRVNYALRSGDQVLELHPFVGRTLTVRATGAKTCTVCGRSVPKFYGQGYCFPCFRDAPEASECIVRPELCRAHLGEGRDPVWEREHHVQEHIVYLSFTGGVKVGVTRSAQMPTRWIDQGAVHALPIARTPHRQLAGLIEVALKKTFADKTDWRAMLRPVVAAPEVLLAERPNVLRELALEMGAYALEEERTWSFTYPIDHLPPKVASVNLDKTPEVSGTLAAIKGQYLIWADGRVLNVRNHSGFHVEIGG